MSTSTGRYLDSSRDYSRDDLSDDSGHKPPRKSKTRQANSDLNGRVGTGNTHPQSRNDPETLETNKPPLPKRRDAESGQSSPPRGSPLIKVFRHITGKVSRKSESHVTTADISPGVHRPVSGISQVCGIFVLSDPCDMRKKSVGCFFCFSKFVNFYAFYGHVSIVSSY